MERYSNYYTAGVTVLCALTSPRMVMLSGHRDGSIRVWKMREGASSQPEYQQDLHSESGKGHNGPVLRLLQLSNSRFVSAGGGDEDPSVCIWQWEDANKNFLFIKRVSIDLNGCESVAVLDDGLLIGACMHSQAWGSFNVWDLDSGAQIHRTIDSRHRPHGLCMVPCKGFLAFNGCCAGPLKIWRISREECQEVGQCADGDRFYSMGATPQGDVVEAGHHITLFHVNCSGAVHQVRKIHNNNVIDIVIPLLGYSFLIVDRARRDSGCIWVRNMLSEDFCTYVGDSYITSQENSWGHTYLPHSNMVISFHKDNFCLHRCPQLKSACGVPKPVGECIRMARVIGQSIRTKTGLFCAEMPLELTLSIVAFAVPQIEEKLLRMIFTDHLGRPTATLANNYA